MKIKYIDSFAGIGGFTLGLLEAIKEKNITDGNHRKSECIGYFEIKKHAIETYNYNFKDENDNFHKLLGDISTINVDSISSFDLFMGGFPCQAFSYAGNKLGFNDKRGLLFFYIRDIIKVKRPSYIILENVKGLLSHDKVHKNNKIGRTFSVILNILDELGYDVTYKVFNALNFGAPHNRDRLFIVCKNRNINEFNSNVFKLKNKDEFNTLLDKVLSNATNKYKQDISFKDIIEHNYTKPTKHMLNKKTINLVNNFTNATNGNLKSLIGKMIADGRNGVNYIKSWDYNLYGTLGEDNSLEKNIRLTLLNICFLYHRQKEFKKNKILTNATNSPMTIDEVIYCLDNFNFERDIKDKDAIIFTIEKLKEYRDNNDINGFKNLLLKEINELLKLGYIKTMNIKYRLKDGSVSNYTELGYHNLINKLNYNYFFFLGDSDKSISKTITATDSYKIGVIDEDLNGKQFIRQITNREFLRLFSYPETYNFSDNITKDKVFDLSGNSLIPNIVKEIILEIIK